jgi:hypothetical protein
MKMLTHVLSALKNCFEGLPNDHPASGFEERNGKAFCSILAIFSTHWTRCNHGHKGFLQMNQPIAHPPLMKSGHIAVCAPLPTST